MLKNAPGFFGKTVFVSVGALDDQHSSRKLPAEVAFESNIFQEWTPREMLT